MHVDVQLVVENHDASHVIGGAREGGVEKRSLFDLVAEINDAGRRGRGGRGFASERIKLVDDAFSGRRRLSDDETKRRSRDVSR